jgi:RNA polymerase sigma-54 factor
LENVIQQELVENPVLEEVISLESSSLESESQVTDEIAVSDGDNKEFDDNWENYFEDSSDVGPIPSEYEAVDSFPEPTITKSDSLKEHLIWQLSLSDLSKYECEIGESVIDCIDDDGYLTLSVEELVEQSGVTQEQIEKIIKMIQTFDPIGVGARNLSECLEIQYHIFGIDEPLMLDMIRNYLPDLEHKRFQKIAKEKGIAVQIVQRIADQIGELEPKPGRKYSVFESEYILPDVFVEKIDGEYQVRVNDDGAPPLRLSRKYRKMIEDRENLTREEYEFLKNKVRSAVWLIENIEQRKRTLRKVTEHIISIQKDFLEEGISGLKPLRLRDVAEAVGVHEATVCRVVNNKYVQTSRGLFELKYFFSSSLDSTSAGADDHSAKSVMDKIKELIENENPQKPLSDQKIADILKKDGIVIARRTVAKYREKMDILPTSSRKRV